MALMAGWNPMQEYSTLQVLLKDMQQENPEGQVWLSQNCMHLQGFNCTDPAVVIYLKSTSAEPWRRNKSYNKIIILWQLIVK